MKVAYHLLIRTHCVTCRCSIYHDDSCRSRVLREYSFVGVGGGLVVVVMSKKFVRQNREFQKGEQARLAISR